MRRILTPLTLTLVLGVLPGLRALCLDTCLVTPSAAGQVASFDEKAASCHDDAPHSFHPPPASAPTSDDCRHGDGRTAQAVRSAGKTALQDLSPEAHAVPIGVSFSHVVIARHVLVSGTDARPVTPSWFVSPLRL
ncbi:MAG: hypothetical protein QF681_17665 [Vicinamibacterales bacterium]|jgi:hypothetical protein|nr:hypothetical protein [Vicinamibacterales bacterium]